MPTRVYIPEFPYGCYSNYIITTMNARHEAEEWLLENFGKPSSQGFIVSPEDRYSIHGGITGYPRQYSFRNLEDFVMFRLKFDFPIVPFFKTSGRGTHHVQI